MDRARCHIHDTSHQIEWLVELKALLGGLDSTDALVGVGSSLVAVAADSNPVAVVADSNPVAVVADSNPVAVVAEAVAEAVEPVGLAAFEPGPQGVEGPLLYQLQVKT
jgi:hypothetical protein